jgi:enoyl-CoA hydratase/carnithine racemase
VSFSTHPTQVPHWTLSVEGDVARLKLDIDEDGGIKPGYKLKLNSYDLGVDIELHDAINRIRFEHPAVKVVVFESGKEKHLVLGRQHLHAGPVHARLEGELLQVHQRDPQRPGRLFAP